MLRELLSWPWKVVVEETNHRLNIFGFLYLGAIAGEEYATSGNNGILDIVEGLKWVKTNIAQFGGDPDNVMICGESGGGYKTSILYGMPAAAPYFNKASIESGPGLRVNSLETAAMVAELTLMGSASMLVAIRPIIGPPRTIFLGVFTKPPHCSTMYLKGVPIRHCRLKGFAIAEPPTVSIRSKQGTPS